MDLESSPSSGLFEELRSVRQAPKGLLGVTYLEALGRLALRPFLDGRMARTSKAIT